MGTTAQKLQRVLDTKEGLKDTINTYLGQDITSAIPFKDYETYIKNFYGSLPKTSYAEGSNITLSNTLKGKLDFEDGIVGYGQIEQDILPEEYQQVEYIESTGTQFITTNYYQTSDNMQLRTKVYIPQMAYSEQDIIGNQDSASGRFILGMFQRKIFGYSKSVAVADINVFSNEYSESQTLDISIDYNSVNKTKTLVTNGVSTNANYNASISNTNRSIQIFANGESNNKFTGRVYFVQILENGTLKLHLIPCYRKSDNEIGLYDLVSNTFFTNAGTETFTKGNNTPTPNVPMDIEVVRGKNRFDSEIEVGSFDESGLNRDSANRLRSKDYIAVLPNTTYTLSVKNNISQTLGMSVSYYTANDYTTPRTSYVNWTNGTTLLFTTPSNCKYIRSLFKYSDDRNMAITNVSDIQLEPGSQATSYLPYNTLEVKARGLNSFDYSVIDNNHISMNNPNSATISFNDNGFTITPITQGDNYTISGMDITNATIRSDLRKYLVEVKPNTTYTFIMDISYSVLAGLSAYYSLIDSDYKVTDFRTSTQNSKTIDSNNRRYFVNITTSADTKYLGFRYGNQGTTAVTYSNIMLVEGTYNADTLPTFEPYQTPQTYQLSLGEYEFAKIGNYVDTIEYDVDEDKVYKDEVINKYQFTGNEIFGKSSSTNLNGYIFNFSSVTTNILVPANNGTKASILSNAFITKAVDTIIGEATYGIGIRSDRGLYIGASLGSFENVSALQTYLANNITFMYYTLITPVKKEITGTLKDQIKALYNSHSFTGTTIIEIDGQLPLIIKVRALKGE